MLPPSAGSAFTRPDDAGSLTGSCGSAAINSPTSIDTMTTIIRSNTPGNWPAIIAPATEMTSATSILGDNQLFTI